MKINRKLVSAALGPTLVFGSNIAGFSATGLQTTEIKNFNNSFIDALDAFKEKIGLKSVIGFSIFACVTLAIRFYLRYAVNKEIFHGDESKYMSEHKIDIKDNIISNPIEINGLRGRDLKLTKPTSQELKGKCVLIFGGSDQNINDVLENLARGNKEVCEKFNSLKVLLEKGATLVGIDYRGYGNSDPVSKTVNMEETLYKDGETVYNYVIDSLVCESKNVILYSYSLGGPVAAHVLDYATNKNQQPGGLILASPMTSLYDAATDCTNKFVGFIAEVGSGYDFNTEKNLSKVKNKDVPVFLCSGGDWDKFSLKKTKLDEKIKKVGFKNVTTNVSQKSSHFDLKGMFEKENELNSPYDNYIRENLAKT